MAEFTLHIRLEPDAGDIGEELLSPYVEKFQGVSFGSDTVTGHSSSNALVPEQSSLDIEGIEQFASIYDELRQHDAVANINLWGPSADRFPVPVQHYALQQIQNPELYEYHAIDDQVTLVIAESEMEAELVRREVPDGALGYSRSPF